MEFYLPKGVTDIQFSDITINMPKNHQWLNRTASRNVLMAYKCQTRGYFNYFKLQNLQKTVTAEITE